MKQPLLLLHGALGSAAQLQPLAERLSGHYEIHALNFSGHGGRLLNEADEFSIRRFADDVKMYLQGAGLKNVPVFGYSMGGYVALYLSATEPGWTGDIFTVATKFDWNPESSRKESGFLDPDKIAFKVPAFAEELKKRHAPADWKLLLKKTAKMMLEMGEWPLLDKKLMTQIKQRVRITVGDQDKMVSRSESEQAASQIPQAEFRLLAGQPHPIEQIDGRMLAGEIMQFFNPSGIK